MLCLVRYLFVISTSVIDCLVPEMAYYVSSGTINLAQLILGSVVVDNKRGSSYQSIPIAELVSPARTLLFHALFSILVSTRTDDRPVVAGLRRQNNNVIGYFARQS